MEFETNFAYICPDCFGIYGTRLNVFSLSSGKAHKFICADKRCRAQSASIRKTSQNKYQLEAVCPFCGQIHSQNLSVFSLWDRAIGTIRCPRAAADIFFYGHDRHAIKELINKTTDMFEQKLSVLNESASGLYSDPIISEILMRLESLMSENQISCLCGCDNIGFELNGSSIALICKRCGRRKELDISKDSLIRLINASGIILGI